MPSLSELARLPDIPGAIQRGTQARQSIAQANAFERQQERQGQLDELFRGADLSNPQARQQIQSGAFNIGAQEGLNVRNLFSQMSAQDLEEARQEARQVAVGLAGVQDQAGYTQALQGLTSRGVDVSSLPEQFDPNQVQFLINSAREIEDISPMTQTQFDQELALRRASRPPGTTVNVGPQGQDFGDPPKDMVFARNPDGTVLTQEVPLEGGGTGLTPVAVPIAGGPVAREEAEAAEAAERRQGQQEMAGNAVSTSASEIRRLVNEARLPTTGLVGSFLSNIGGTTARDVAAELNTIEANVGFGQLQAMRDASPTGGALGQVSENENRLLQSLLGSLAQSQSKEQFLSNLDRVENAFRVLTAGTPEERDRLLAEGQTAGSSAPEGTIITNPTTGETLIKSGGQWVPQ